MNNLVRDLKYYSLVLVLALTIVAVGKVLLVALLAAGKGIL